MKKIFLLLISSIIYTHCIAQRYDGKRTYDIIGLANENEIGECLIKGIPFLLIGLILLCYKFNIDWYSRINNVTIISMDRGSFC